MAVRGSTHRHPRRTTAAEMLVVVVRTLRDEMRRLEDLTSRNGVWHLVTAYSLKRHSAPLGWERDTRPPHRGMTHAAILFPSFACRWPHGHDPRGRPQHDRGDRDRRTRRRGRLDHRWPAGSPGELHPGGSPGASSHASQAGAGGKGSSSATGNPALPGSHTGTALTGVGTYANVNTGLMIRNPSPPPSSLDQYVDGYIIEAAWNVVEPTQGAFVTTRIDKAVAAVRKWNAANPNNQREDSGCGSPQGSTRRHGRSTSAVPRSSSAHRAERAARSPAGGPRPVEAAYQAFTARLAAYVNPMPEVREVTVELTDAGPLW